MQVDNYNRWNFSLDPTWSEDQKQEYYNLAVAAEKNLTALFCDKFEFDSSSSIKLYLGSHYQNDDGLVIDTIMQWADDLLQSFDQKDDHPFLYFESATGNGLNNDLDPHIFEQSDNSDSPHLWPLIKFVW